ncbi:Subtilase family domain protein [Bacillus thuringiensis serovar huazhongensis BGSC 4BD1]|nr:Subtilase family domain protein [Bacillus thuringiensis serovar huazhongensis BGSC 4BD1]
MNGKSPSNPAKFLSSIALPTVTKPVSSFGSFTFAVTPLSEVAFQKQD